ncbi:polysaccharide deacetylase family protein [Anaerobacillus sp. CMMVII]|uniref:polysaccharide deacetylase family protein n=1 Tax=Anaerobacillus sp. CMMVII TaxID=2755588 RepID=UPI0021B82BE8|nr:polysaccharide deacetylase family protein [Anaerobacillus sp. CMMVII]MCT8137816.1 polysaccharide deacetylase family protein [Anaerobacillus sp. CMMVII]
MNFIKSKYFSGAGIVLLAFFIGISSYWVGSNRYVKDFDGKETELSEIKKEREEIAKQLEELESHLENKQKRLVQLEKQLTRFEKLVNEKDEMLFIKDEQFKEFQKLQEEKMKDLEAEIKRLNEERKTITDKKDKTPTPTTPTANKKVFLTFDDGPTSLTPHVLKTLKEHNVHATFFTIGKRMEAMPNVVRDIYQEGHMVLPHSYSHDYAIYTTFETFYSDFYKAEQTYKDVLGFKPPQIFRFPGGSSNQSSFQYGGKQFMPSLTIDLKEKGYTYVDWNVTSGDAGPDAKNQAKLYENIVTTSANKDFVIVLFHDVSSNEATANVLPEVINYYKKNGFTFRTFRDVTKEELQRMEALKLSNKTISY